MIKFEKGDIVTYKMLRVVLTETVLTTTEKSIGCSSGFFSIRNDKLFNGYSEIEVLEVFRRDGDIYKRIYIKE